MRKSDLGLGGSPIYGDAENGWYRNAGSYQQPKQNGLIGCGSISPLIARQIGILGCDSLLIPTGCAGTSEMRWSLTSLCHFGNSTLHFRLTRPSVYNYPLQWRFEELERRGSH
jgi:hypothetical protein